MDNLQIRKPCFKVMYETAAYMINNKNVQETYYRGNHLQIKIINMLNKSIW